MAGNIVFRSCILIFSFVNAEQTPYEQYNVRGNRNLSI